MFEGLESRQMFNLCEKTIRRGNINWIHAYVEATVVVSSIWNYCFCDVYSTILEILSSSLFEAISTLHEGQGNFFSTSASISKVRTVASKELSIKKELIIARTRKSSFQRVALIFFASGSDFELSKEFSSQSFGLHSNFGGKKLDSHVFKVALEIVMVCLSSRLAHAWKVLGAVVVV